MASDAMLNFDVEHEKLTTRLKLFTDVIESRRLLKENDDEISALELQISRIIAETASLAVAYGKKAKELSTKYELEKATWEKGNSEQVEAGQLDHNDFVAGMYDKDKPDLNGKRSVEEAQEHESSCQKKFAEAEKAVEFMKKLAQGLGSRQEIYLLEVSAAKMAVTRALREEALQKDMDMVVELKSKADAYKLKLATAEEAWVLAYGKGTAAENEKEQVVNERIKVCLMGS